MSRDSNFDDGEDGGVSRRDVLKTVGGATALGAVGALGSGTAAAAPSMDAALLADDVDLNLYWQDDQAWYDSTDDRTYHVYQSVDTGGDSTGEEDSDGDAYIVAYDHSDGSVEGPVRIGYNDLNNGDTHGVPALAVDGDGYIHVIFGDHGQTGSFEYGRSENPYDISSWIHPPSGTDGSGDLNQLPAGTYPNLAYDPNGDAVYVVYRAGNGSGNYPSHDHATLGKTTDNGVNWTDVNNGIIDLTGSPWNHTDPYVTDLDAWAGRIHVSWAIAESDDHGDPRRHVYHAAYNPGTGNMETMSGTSLGGTISYTEAENQCKIKDTTDIDVTEDGRSGSVYDFNQTYDPNTDTAYIPVHYPIDKDTSQLRLLSYAGVSTQSGTWQESGQIATMTDPPRLNSHVRINDSGEIELKMARGRNGLWRKENGTWNHYDYVAGTSEISKIQRPVKNGTDEFGWVGRTINNINGDGYRVVYALGFGQDAGAGATPTRPPQNLRVTNTNGTTVTLDWDSGLAGPSGVAKFKVYVDGVHEKDVTTTPVAGNPYPRTWTTVDPGSGQHDIEVSLVNGNATESATSNTVTVGDTETLPIAVNCAGNSFTAGSGITYDADRNFTTSKTYSTGDAISGTDDDALYQGERYDGGGFTYSFDVENGTYDVTLKFAEIYQTTDGQRVMDVDIEGTEVIGDLDIHAEVGHDAAYDETHTVSVTDGTLDIAFPGDNAAGAPKISAILVEESGGQSPYGGSAHAIPGRIEGEDFDEGGDGVAWSDTSPGTNEGSASYRPNEGVDISNASDEGGTEYNISYVDPDEWLEYTVDVASAGSYDLDLRVATNNTGGKDMHVEVDGTDVTGTVTVNDTGGWQSYTTKTVTDIDLSAGQHVVRVYFEDGGINYNYMEWSENQVSFVGDAHAIPGKIEAEDFDEGGSGVAYNDTTSGNNGGSTYRSGTDVDLGTGGSGVNLGWTADDEWLEYTVDVDSAGTYDLDLRVASNSSGGATIHFEFDGTDETGSINVPNNGSWGTFQTITETGISLDAGQQVMRLYVDSAACNIDWLEWK